MSIRQSNNEQLYHGGDEESNSSSFEEVEVEVATAAGIREPSSSLALLDKKFPSKSARYRCSLSSNGSTSVQGRCNIRRCGISLLVSVLITTAYYNNTSLIDQLAKLRVNIDVPNASVGTSSNELLPDWRIVTECSVYNTDCAAHMRGRLSEYPFKVKTSVDAVGEDGEYGFDHIGSGELPQEWSQALAEFAPPMSEDPPPLQLDGDRLSALVFPPKGERARHCYEMRLSTSFDEQLETMFSYLKPVADIDMIAWTMTDEKYSKDMLVDVWEMNNEIVGFRGAFFFLALDEFTLQLACEYGYPVVAAPALTAKNKDTNSDLKSLVQSTKFIVSRAIVDRMQSFFFYEMDCWFIKSPIDVLKQQQTDYLVSSHQWNPFGGNIGIYAVKANKSTQEFFKHLVEFSALSPNTHDQIVMNDLASYTSRLYKGEKISSLGADHLGRWDPIPERMPEVKHPMSKSHFGPHHMVAGPYPIPTETTLAIHTLDNTPLMPPHGKKMVAKELGAYTGFVGTPESGGGYYKRTGARRRYLMMDGRVLGGYSTIQQGTYHDYLKLQWNIAVLVALARRTDRIFILPRIVSDFHTIFLWKNLDMESLERLVDVRETNFPSNKKAWYSPDVPFKTVARVALYPGFNNKEDGRLFAQASESGNEVFAWEIEGDAQKVDGLFGLVSASPELHEAEALFFNPSFALGNWDWRVATREQKGVLSPAEKEILYVFDQLRWCGTELDLGRPAVKYSSEDDCYGKGKHATRHGKSKH